MKPKQQVHNVHNPFAEVIPKKTLGYHVFWLVSYITCPILIPIRLIIIFVGLFTMKILTQILTKELDVTKPIHSVRKRMIQKII